MNRRKPYKLYILETDKTKVSVIIPTLNQEKLIGKCIESLLCQSYQQSLIEIIVVDNGSMDKTVDIVKKYPVKLVAETKKGPAAARNAGIKIAAGEILIFLDHDCFADKDFVAYHVWAQNHNIKINSQVKLIAGGIAGYNTNLWAVCDDIYSWYNSHPKLPSRYETDYLPAANISIASDVINTLVGFEAGMMGGEDVVLCTKIKKHGYKIYFEPRVKVYHKGFFFSQAGDFLLVLLILNYIYYDWHKVCFFYKYNASHSLTYANHKLQLAIYCILDMDNVAICKFLN